MNFQSHFLEDYGFSLAAIGAVISCLGVVYNNIRLDHIAAMEVWMFSNTVLLIWSFGLYKKWWDGGLSGAVLCGMYLFYTVTNIWGLMHV
jgi:Ca2+/Na+ antiporter